MNCKVRSPIIEIVTTVVVVANLLLILGSRVDDNLRNQVKEDVFEEFRREVEVSPIVAEFHNFEDVAWKMTCQLELKAEVLSRTYEQDFTFKVNLAVEICVVENLHGDLVLSVIIFFKLFITNVDVLCNIFPRQLYALVDATADVRHEHPITKRDGEAEESNEEPVRVEPASVDERKGALDHIGHAEDERSEMIVRERAAALSQAKHRRVLQRRPRCGLWW